MQNLRGIYSGKNDTATNAERTDIVNKVATIQKTKFADTIQEHKISADGTQVISYDTTSGKDTVLYDTTKDSDLSKKTKIMLDNIIKTCNNVEKEKRIQHLALLESLG
jgi:hypothetical protein